MPSREMDILDYFKQGINNKIEKHVEMYLENSVKNEKEFKKNSNIYNIFSLKAIT